MYRYMYTEHKHIYTTQIHTQIFTHTHMYPHSLTVMRLHTAPGPSSHPQSPW